MNVSNLSLRVSASPRPRVWAGGGTRPCVRDGGLLGLLLVSFVLANSAFALDIPPAPTQWVTDKAGILSSSGVQALNNKLRAFEERSGAQFLIYVLPSLEGDSLERFTVDAAQKWGVGQKKYDNGLILFVFVKERQTRLEVGYGLEGTITDAYSSRILREVIAPYFRQGDYAGGFNAAVDQIIARIEGNEPPVPVAPARAPSTGSGLNFFQILFWIFIIMIVLMALRGGGCCLFPFFLGGGGRTYGGGGWSGGGGGFGGFSGGGGGFGGGGASGSW